MTVAFVSLPDPLYVGTSVTVEVGFTNPGSSDLVDPSTVAFKYQQGGSSGAWTTLNYPADITRTDNIYSAEIPTTLAGQMTVQAIGTGTCAVVEVATCFVTAPPGS